MTSTTDYALIRVEAINLDQAIFDTNDVSIQRGGSALLLEVAKSVAQKINCEVISQGASIAILRVPQAELMSSTLTLREYFANNFPNLSVEVTGASNGVSFHQNEQLAIAQSAWNQLQQPTIAGSFVREYKTNDVCEFDRVRPSCREKVKGRQISQFGNERFKQGRVLRQTLYEVVTGINNFDFPDDLRELAQFDLEANLDFRMNRKIAVVYFDGNNFGEIADSASCKNQLKSWDNYIQGKRAELLKAILTWASETPIMNLPTQTDSSKKLRLETLLWGGDETMFVVPAAAGFALTHLILNCTADWQYPTGQQKLTHKFGVVFCHDKAPISGIRNLVSAMADRAKTGNTNVVAWTVLESFDHLGVDFEAGIARRYNHAFNFSDWVMSGELFNAYFRSLNPLLLAKRIGAPDSEALLPRSQIIRAAMEVIQETKIIEGANKRMQHAIRETFDVNETLKAAWRTLAQLSADDKAGTDLVTSHTTEKLTWLRLAEAYDYMGHTAFPESNQ